jgi:putative transposase
MKRVSVYLKLRVLGAIDSMGGNSIKSRILEVSKLTFHDEDGTPHVFTWRTIQTWLSLYKQLGVQALVSRPRADKGKHRKLSPEQLQEALEQVRGEFRDTRYNKMMLYRRIIERGLLAQTDCSQTSFFRLVREFDLLTPVCETENKRRLAFSKQYANEMWQMDTLVGPYVKNGKVSTQSKLIAFIDDASRVVPHGQFFFSENTDSLIVTLKAALYKRGIPQTMARSTPVRRSTRYAPDSASSCATPLYGTAPPRERSKDSSEPFATSSSCGNWTSPASMYSTASSITGSRTTTTPMSTAPCR